MNTDETQAQMPGPNLEPAVLHMHPLAYLLGLQGVALFRSFNGEYDRAYAEARIAEIRYLLDAADEIGLGIDVPVIATSDAYDGWAPYYHGRFKIQTLDDDQHRYVYGRDGVRRVGVK
jgi:hypothetical protein